MIEAAGHHRHEQRDRLIVFIRVDIVEEVAPQRRDDIETGHRRPCLVEICPAPLGVGLEDDLGEAVEDTPAGTIHRDGHQPVRRGVATLGNRRFAHIPAVVTVAVS